MSTRPPSGVNESCIELTDPFDAAVVAVAQSAELPMPKRASLPSMFPPGWKAVAWSSAPSPRSLGLPACSKDTVASRSGTKITSIATSSVYPWRRAPTITPKVTQRAAEIRRMESASTKLASGVGFSKGWAEFTLKKPPPFVPSCLIAIWEAAGPRARVCPVTSLPSASFVGSRRGTVTEARSVCTAPCEQRTRPTSRERGKST